MIITLTSDFGLKDHYVGALKGLIYSKISNANLVDISHEVSPFVLQEAAYVVGAAYHYFPDKTIHLILADAEFTQEKRPIIVFWNNHYFLSADSGILSLIVADQKPEAIIALPFEEHEDTTELFVKAVIEIVNGRSIFDIGETITSLKAVQPLKAVVSDDKTKITGNIIYVDRFGNAVSNISKDLFEQLRAGRSFDVLFRNYRIRKIHNTYIDYASEKNAEDGGKLAIFNQSGLLEIALYKGSQRSGGTASSLLGIEYESSISILFK